jgi:alanine-glyoxylate transaminase/serine-glyoxylate transaminase/serine-pyruvate transaminase
MSCGQTALHPRVLAALGEQIQGPIYYPAYWKLELDTIDLLRRLMHTRNDILLIAGSATYGEEAALTSLLERGDRVLVANCGMYGQVLVDLVQILGGQTVNLQAPEGQAISCEAIREQLLADPDIALVACVYCDTSTGVMTDVEEIGPMLRREFPSTIFLVDAVSALGAVPIDVDGWGIDLCCSSPQKCLNAPQGLAIVSVGPRAWAKIAQRTTPIGTLCLDLTVWKDYHDGVAAAYAGGTWSDISTATRKAIHGPSPSYTLVAGLHAALEALFDEGPERVFERHRVAARAVREGIRAMGLKVLADETVAAPISTRLVFSESIDWTTLASRMLAEQGIALASGFRIGTMGQSASRDAVLATLDGLERVLRKLGYPVRSGGEAARAIFDA